MKPQLLHQTHAVLEDLRHLLLQLEPGQYPVSLEVLHGNSAGKHCRHILEFFAALESEGEEINYDLRKRDLVLETDRETALEKISQLQERVSGLKDRPVFLVVDYGESPQKVQSSLFRELVYNIEHATHHLAILKVGLEQEFHWQHLPKHLGMAYSTLQYQKA